MTYKFDQYGQLIAEETDLPAGITHNHALSAYNAKAKEGGLIGTFATKEEAVNARESFTGHVSCITFNTRLGKWVVKHNHTILGEFVTQQEAIKAKPEYAKSRALLADVVNGIRNGPPT